MPDQPNILFILTDQHRATAMGCAGNPDVHTPNMDQLAAEGTRFTNAYANDPVCTPSRGCILTGQYSFTHEAIINEFRMSEDAPTIAKELNEDYRTGYIGKWHLDGLPRDRWTPPGPRRQGFEDYWAINQSAHDYLGSHYYTDDPEPIHVDGYTPAHETDLAIEFMSEDQNDPFCLFLAWGPPHTPYSKVPDEYKKRYEPDDIQLRPNVEPDLGRTVTESDQETEIRESIRDYYAQVTALDAQLGLLLDYLDESGLADDTIVVFTSDHGDQLWSHSRGEGRFVKGEPWEESINIPFLIRWPRKIPAGEVSDNFISTVDMTPTLLGLVGKEPPSEMEGTDLSKTVRGIDEESPDSVYLLRSARLQERGEWRGVRTDRYTYVETLDGTPWLLYDNIDDPYQLTNLVFKPEYTDIQEDLAETLSEWQSRLGDPRLPGKDLAEKHDKLDEFYAGQDYYGF